jgi:hypothetical protein
MFRLLLILGLVGLLLTNPTTDEVRSQVMAHFAPQIGGGAGGAPLAQSGFPDAVAAVVGKQLPDVVQIERQNYFVLSIYKVAVVGPNSSSTVLPGCVIGIAKQAVPYDQC